jgi:hypothetical protein
LLEVHQIAESALVLAVDEGLFGVDGAEEAQLVREVAMGKGHPVGAQARETGFVVGLFVLLHDARDVEAEEEQAAFLAVDGGGELFDEFAFGCADGAEIGNVVVEHPLEVGGIVDVGEEGMEVDERGFGGGGGFGTAGLGAVAAGGRLLRGCAFASGFGGRCGGAFVLRHSLTLRTRD